MAVAGVLVFLLLFTLALSASHSLHQLLHQDGSSGQHFCLACAFAKAKASDVPAPCGSALPPRHCIYEICLAPVPPQTCFEYLLLPGRAPPSIFFSIIG
jgi:hypothetical protein